MDFKRNPEQYSITIKPIINAYSQQLDINSDESRKDRSEKGDSMVPAYYIEVDGVEVCYIRGKGYSRKEMREVTVLPKQQLSEELIQRILKEVASIRSNGGDVYFRVMGPYLNSFEIFYREYVFIKSSGELEELDTEEPQEF